jgi:hypothetical protein
MLACVCAIDRAVFPAHLDYWVPGVGNCGVSELVANALIMEGEIPRQYNLRGEEVNDLREEVGLEPIEWPSEEGEEAEDSTTEGEE